MASTAPRTFPTFRLALNAYRDTFRFTGRSRRLELVYFYLLASVLGLMLSVALGGLRVDMGNATDTFLAPRIVETAAHALVVIPMFALMTRRLHDIGLPGWIAPPVMFYAVAINQWQAYWVVSGALPYPPSAFAWLAPLSDPPSTSLWLLTIPCALIVLLATIAPGVAGPNRYGPDPRD